MYTAQFAKYILLHTYSRTTAAPSYASINENFISYLTAGI